MRILWHQRRLYIPPERLVSAGPVRCSDQAHDHARSHQEKHCAAHRGCPSAHGYTSCSDPLRRFTGADGQESIRSSAPLSTATTSRVRLQASGCRIQTPRNAPSGQQGEEPSSGPREKIHRGFIALCSNEPDCGRDGRTADRTGDEKREPPHKSTTNLKGEHPPALLGLTRQHLGAIAQIPSCIRSAFAPAAEGAPSARRSRRTGNSSASRLRVSSQVAWD
jgi:hypothetical protein